MQTITLINEKGGVGKTTLSTHIAAGLAIQGQRVLIVDADAQAHSTYALGGTEHGGLYRLLVQEDNWKSLLQVPNAENWAGDHPADGSLWLLPSNIETRGIPLMVSEVDLLHERLAELEGYVDVVIIDTSPTPSLLHAMIYHASDGVIFPAECEALSLDGLAKSTQRMVKESQNRQREGRAPLQLIGVQPTMFDPRTNAHQFGLSQIAGHFGQQRTWDPINTRTAWRDAAYEQKTVFAYAPDSPAAFEAWRMIETLKSV